MSETPQPMSVITGAISIRVAAVFRARTAAIAAAAREVRRGGHPEAIHDLRVATRRLGAALDVWRNLLDPGDRRLAKRGLRSLRRRLTAAREAEVNVELLRERLAVLGAEARLAAAPVLESERLRRNRRRRKAGDVARGKRIRRLLRRVRDATRELGTRLSMDPRAIDGAAAFERRAEARWREALRGALEHADDASLHEARIAAKKWRYAVECLEGLRVHAPAGLLEELTRFQDLLGGIHDAALLVELLRRASLLTVSIPGSGLGPLIESLEAERGRSLEELRQALPRIPAAAGDATPHIGLALRTDRG